MKITIEPTPSTTKIDGVPVRMWVGKTDAGARVTLAVHRVIVHDAQQHDEFFRELSICMHPLDDEHHREIENLVDTTWRERGDDAART
jgi:hypothetical protein